MKRLSLNTCAPLLAALAVTLGACDQAERMGPLTPDEPSVFAKGGNGKPGGGGGNGGGGSSQLIAFSATSTNARIYTIGPDGTGYSTIRDTEGGSDPAWSPDRKKLAFVVNIGSGPGVYVISTNGKQRQRIYSGNAYSPTWSPDGTKIAFQATVAGSPQILVVRSDGSDLQQATAVGMSRHPSWSPDGTRIAYIGSRPEGAGIWMLDHRTGQHDLIVSCLRCMSPEWSPIPGDERIAYSMFDVSGSSYFASLNLVNSDGSQPRQFLYSSNHAFIDLSPTWSPDATKLVFNSAMFGSRDLVMVDVDGTNPRVVANLAGDQTSPAWAR